MNRFEIIVLTSVMLVIAGCGKEASPPVKPEVTAKEAAQEVKEAASTAAQYVRQEKDEFVMSAEKSMDELKANLAELTNKAQAASGDTKAKLEQQIKTLEGKWDAAQVKLGEIKNASGEAWKEMQQGVSEAIADLKRAYDDAGKEFEKKS